MDIGVALLASLAGIGLLAMLASTGMLATARGFMVGQSSRVASPSAARRAGHSGTPPPAPATAALLPTFPFVGDGGAMLEEQDSVNADDAALVALNESAAAPLACAAADPSSVGDAEYAGLRVLIVALGTRGDTQPARMLADGLASKGAHVMLLLNGGKDGDRSVGVRGGRVSECSFKEELSVDKISTNKQLLYRACCARRHVETFRVLRDRGTRRQIVASATGDFKPDIIVSTPAYRDDCIMLRDALRVPLMTLTMQPIAPTAEYPPPALFAANVCGGRLPRIVDRFVNRALHAFMAIFLWVLLCDVRLTTALAVHRHACAAGRGVRAWRCWAVLRVRGPFASSTVPSIEAYSSAIVNVPRDKAPAAVITGPFVPPSSSDNEALPADLDAFLRKHGASPVYIGFGSMAVPDPGVLLDGAARVHEELGVPVVLCTGSSGVDHKQTPPSGVFLIDSVSHAALLPQCAAAVHHGGSGTTNATLLHGVPTVVFPVVFDQPYWAQRVSDLKAGPARVIPLRDLTVQNLVEQVRDALTRKTNAAEVVTRFRFGTERGVESAAAVVAAYASHWRGNSVMCATTRV